MLGRTMMDVYPGIENTAVFATLQRCMQERVSQQMENEFTYPDGAKSWFELSIQPVPEGIFILSIDITARKEAEERIRASLKEKEVLLKEIHHRVKNNLQVITSLLKLQSKYVKDKHAVEMFVESQQRVKTMALIHEELYKSVDMARIEFAPYVKNLAGQLHRLYGARSRGIALEVQVADVLLDVDRAIPSGLIINELMSNSLKYAFPQAFLAQHKEHPNTVRIELQEQNKERLMLRVSDNGIGLPADFDLHNTPTLGMQLVSTLAEQLRGTLDCRNEEGTQITITFASSKHKDGANGACQNNGR
jgi:two-component sensor histidine kinase